VLFSHDATGQCTVVAWAPVYFLVGFFKTMGHYLVLKIFAARRYVSAVFAVVKCPSVRPSFSLSQADTVSKRLDVSSWFLTWRLPSTYIYIYTTLCCKEIWVSPRIAILPSGTSSPTAAYFATARRRRCQRNSSSLSSSTVELVDDTYTTTSAWRCGLMSDSSVMLCKFRFIKSSSHRKGSLTAHELN